MWPEESDCVTVGTLASLFCKAWGDGLKWKNVCEDAPHEAKISETGLLTYQVCIGLETVLGYPHGNRKPWNGRGYMQRMGISAHAWRHRLTSF